jgi:hypothetical protein
VNVVSRTVARGMRLREAHDSAWSEWDGQHSPLLSCKLSALAHPDALVEITVTAAR